jgi:hypothetical protein
MQMQKWLRAALAPLLGVALLGLTGPACAQEASTEDAPDVAAEPAEDTDQQAEGATAPAEDSEQPGEDAEEPGEEPER